MSPVVGPRPDPTHGVSPYSLPAPGPVEQRAGLLEKPQELSGLQESQIAPVRFDNSRPDSGPSPGEATRARRGTPRNAPVLVASSPVRPRGPRHENPSCS